MFSYILTKVLFILFFFGGGGFSFYQCFHLLLLNELTVSGNKYLKNIKFQSILSITMNTLSCKKLNPIHLYLMIVR